MIPKYKILLLFFIFVFSVFVGVASSDEDELETIQLVIGKSKLITVPVSIKRASIGDPTIADIRVLRQKKPAELYVRGVAPGVTNLILWKSDDNYYKTYDLHISVDMAQLKRKMDEILPEENIEVEAAGRCVILSGEVSSTANLSTAVELAKTFIHAFKKSEGGTSQGKDGGVVKEEKREVAVEPKIVNLMQVGGVQQVMLEVRVAEMGRKLMKRLGVNFSYFSGEDFVLGMLNNLTVIDEALPAIGVTSPINALFRFHHGNASWTGFIDALKTEGIIKILAKPTLVTLSGENAEFLAGGEFPVPVPGEWDKTEIEWKKYGVELQFTPRVLSNDKISLKVLPAVSELDYENAVEFSGYVIPALTTRYASTTIELDDGQSFAIAGLLNEKVYENIAKYPILGDIPVLGALFRSSEFRKHESELVIIVTPHLVKPLDMAKQILPTDAYVEPNDFEFYLLGLKEGVRKGEKRSSVLFRDEGLEGNFGHISP
ncbi:MAG: type II and III secretion system protein family protein [Thermodesulfobacteriota bacterium]|nr:type II and III secretion system protein family protein [Thermodesulfobacteriota bacterium]